MMATFQFDSLILCNLTNGPSGSDDLKGSEKHTDSTRRFKVTK